MLVRKLAGAVLDHLTQTHDFNVFALAPTPITGRAEKSGVNREMIRYVGVCLRAHYDQLLSLPLPPKLVDFLTEYERLAGEAPSRSGH